MNKFVRNPATAAVVEWLLELPGRWKAFLAVVFDLVVVPLSLWLAFWIRLGEPVAVTGKWWPLFVSAPVLALPFFAYLGLYRVVVRHIGFQVLWMVAKGVVVAVLAWVLIALLLRIPDLPRSVVFIYGLLVFVFVGVGRLAASWLLRRTAGERIVIYGAGSSGAQLATALQHSAEVSPVAFLDDAPALQGSHVAGLRVHPLEHFEKIRDRYGVKEVLIAIPARSHEERGRLVNRLEPYSVRVRLMPLVSELAQGKVSFTDFQQVDAEDLLGRDPVPPQRALLEADVKGRSVLVTGAGGSIGSELCRQILDLAPRRLVVLEQSESALYEIDQRLRERGDGDSLTAVLGSVLDRGLIETVLREHSIETLYHAAAYKHVPIVEDNVIEGVRNNALGTRVVAEAAVEAGVATFVLISTDKAVRPTSVMGASKRLAEMILQSLALSRAGKTRFSVVRFGNVLDSSGSVVPLFRRQIAERKPLTVTDPAATRYFMTVNEAVELVIQAGAMAKGGEIFVLDMGEAVHIGELARKMVHLSGLSVKSKDRPLGDVEIHYTGLRPGEKLNEELLTDSNVLETDHPKILWLQNTPQQWTVLEALLDKIEQAAGARRTDEVGALVKEAAEVRGSP